jgi:hypothetical protein
MKNFKRMTAPEQQAYMLTQKRKRVALGDGPSNVPYDFTDLTGTQRQFDVNSTEDDIRTDWLPFGRWYPMQKAFKPELTPEKGEVEFNALLTSGTVRSKKINGIWCVADFAGGSTLEKHERGFEYSLGRSASLRGQAATNHFVTHSSDVAEGRRSQPNHEGGYCILQARHAHDHDVVMNEAERPEPVTFNRMASNDQQKAHLLAQHELSNLQDGLPAAPKEREKKSTPLWVRKLDLEKKCTQHHMTWSSLADASRSELAGRNFELIEVLSIAPESVSGDLRVEQETKYGAAKLAFDEFEKTLAGYVQEIKSLRPKELEAPQIIKALEQIKKWDAAVKASRKPFHDKLKELRLFGAEVQRKVQFVNNAMQRKRTSKRGEGQQASDTPLCALLASLQEVPLSVDLQSQGAKTELDCLYQGNPVYLKGESIDILKGEVEKHPYFTQQQTSLAKIMNKNKNQLAEAGVAQAKASRDFKRFLNQAGFGELLHSLYLDKKAGMMRAYDFVNFLHAEGQHSCHLEPYCLPSVRIVTDGAEVVVGVKFAAAPGQG